MNASEIPVIKEDQFKSYRQTIRPRTQEEVPDILVATHSLMREGKFTGRMTIEWNEGGVRSMVSEQMAQEFSNDVEESE